MSAGPVTVARTLLDRRTQRQIFLYGATGALCFTIDLGVFRAVLSWHRVAEQAAVVSGLISMIVHFLLNKYVNFRNNKRTLRAQLGTYCVVVGVWWIVTLTVIAVMTRCLGAAPLVAKLVAVGLNFPLGFFAQRQLTFGAGIAAAIRRRQAARTGS